ncbi:ComEC/Rec2 family competence protein [Roseibium sp. SCP14]|uniref:ComEC/Rec2 family competence protein n=1 Tax=Roseibium sp. SCP14 TaxID=3141375 RepID=UPI00333B53D0
MRKARGGLFWEEQGLLWIGFAFAAGIACYLILPGEPHWLLLAMLFALACGVAVRFGVSGARGKFVLLALACLGGVVIGSMRTAFVDAPKLGEEMNVNLSGYALERRSNASGTRLLVKVLNVEGRSREALGFPKLVRLRVPAEPLVNVGDKIEVRARLFPPAGPVAPGDYDFSFRAFFSQIGATGFSFGPPVVVPYDETPLDVQLRSVLQGFRDTIGAKIKAALRDTPEASLAVALLVGDRSGIAKEQEEDLRAAGLAHILAISGLHMALFAGGAYAIVLLILAVIPALPLRWPTHKWAAVAALVAAFVYLLLSGASVATQRSFLMIGLVFLGVLVGRRGLTLRSVAIAGLALLLLAPERLFFPGFQMSFAAVICLIAVYEIWRNRELSIGRGVPAEAGPISLLLRNAFRWSAGLVVTASVAGLATGIIGAHHFGQVAPFGVVGNLLGMPVFSLVIMPLGVLALVLMPLGLASFPLTVMSMGISWLLKIAEFTAQLDAGAGAVGKLSAPAALLFTSSFFAVLLLPGRQRIWAIMPMVAGALLLISQRPPDIQIASSGVRVAARDEQGFLRWTGRRQSFATDIWFASEGVVSSAIKSRKMKSPQVRCDASGCVVLAYPASSEGDLNTALNTPLKVALPRTADAFRLDCEHADIVVSDLIIPETCRTATSIGGAVREERGAVSIWLSREKMAYATQTDQPEVDSQSGVKISKIKFAVSANPRPWHMPGTFTREKLKQVQREN